MKALNNCLSQAMKGTKIYKKINQKAYILKQTLHKSKREYNNHEMKRK